MVGCVGCVSLWSVSARLIELISLIQISTRLCTVKLAFNLSKRVSVAKVHFLKTVRLGNKFNKKTTTNQKGEGEEELIISECLKLK